MALCCGAIWRHREKPQYRCTTTLHPVYNCWKKILENLLPVWILVRTNLFIPSRFYPRDVVSGVLATATCLAGWVAGLVSVTRRYCIKTFKPIWKLFRPSEIPITLVSWDPCNSKNIYPSAGALNTRGGIGDFRAIFDGYRRLSRKGCEIGRWLLWNVMGAGLNGIIFDDLEWPLTWVSRSRDTYKSNISKTVRFRDNVTKEQ